MRFRLAATSLLAVSALVAGAGTASAVDGTTTVTLSSVDTLTILPTAAAALVTTGTKASGTLGATTIVDPSGADRTVSISSVGFTEAGGSATIAATKVSACVSTGPTNVTATSTFTSVADCAAKAALTGTAASAKATLFAVTGSGLLSEYVFTPTIEVDVAGAKASTYTGTITQTVV